MTFDKKPLSKNKKNTKLFPTNNIICGSFQELSQKSSVTYLGKTFCTICCLGVFKNQPLLLKIYGGKFGLSVSTVSSKPLALRITIYFPNKLTGQVIYDNPTIGMILRLADNPPPYVGRERIKGRSCRDGVLNKYGKKCHWCGCQFDFEKCRKTFDHIISPLFGGTNSNHNIVPACETCNKARGNTMEWLEITYGKQLLPNEKPYLSIGNVPKKIQALGRLYLRHHRHGEYYKSDCCEFAMINKGYALYGSNGNQSFKRFIKISQYHKHYCIQFMKNSIDKLETFRTTGKDKLMRQGEGVRS